MKEGMEFEELKAADDVLERIDTLPPLLNEPQCEGDYDGEPCGKPATMEWKFGDDEGSYYTYRCDEHPVKAREYLGVDL